MKHQKVVKELERRIGQGNRRLSSLVDLRSLHEYNLHPQHGPDGPHCPYRPWCNYTIRLTLSGSSFSRCQKDLVRQNGLANASFPAAPTQPKENSFFCCCFFFYHGESLRSQSNVRMRFVENIFVFIRFTPMQRAYISWVLKGDGWWDGRNPRRTLLTFSPGAWKDRMKSKLSSGMNNNELGLMSRLLLVC